ncbi:hypothetical protein COHA_003892 [Chlorella ohadii]|uniref:MYND-type domain-containing protein n=1 Tax=Chlorella ohadii TaxID=2649997 RepID=A0AAD5DU09_9CHLO|nr:hypothetical protein COHA_003892 [Chlorella ohadii]
MHFTNNHMHFTTSMAGAIWAAAAAAAAGATCAAWARQGFPCGAARYAPYGTAISSDVLERLRQLTARVKAGLGDAGPASVLAAEAEELLRDVEALQGALNPGELQEAIHEVDLCIVTTPHAGTPAGVTTNADAAQPLLWHFIATCRLGATCKGSSLALALLETGPAGGWERAAAQLLQAQLQAARLCLISGAHVAFNSGALPPQRLADWLAAMAALLSRLQVAPGDAAVKGVLEQVQLCHLPAVCEALFFSNAYEALHPAMMSGPFPGQLLAQLAPALSLLSVLLALPEDRRPPGITWASVRPLASVFYFAPLADAEQRWFAAATSGERLTLLAGAARLMAQLPIDEQPPGLPGGPAEHSATAISLCMCLGLLCKESLAPGPRLALGLAQRRRLVPALLAAIAQLPGMLQLMAAGLDVPEPTVEPYSCQLRFPPYYSCYCAAVSAISSMAGLLHDWMDEDASWCGGDEEQPAPPTLVQDTREALPWACAATAALRCGPALAAIDRRLEQLPAGRPYVPPEVLSPGQILQELALLAARTIVPLPAKASQAALPPARGCTDPSDAQAAVWELHTAGCRFIHWCVADGWCNLNASHAGNQLVHVLSETLRAQSELHRMEQVRARQTSNAGSGSGSGSSVTARTCRALEAMCAAHWPALQALSACCNLERHAGLQGCSKLAVSLVICMGKGPPNLAADADLQRMFGCMLSCVLQVPSCSWGYHSLMFLTAEYAPRLAALLVTSGHLEEMTEAVEGLDPSLVPAMPLAFAPGVWNIVADALWEEAVELLKGPSLDPATWEALRAAAATLQAMLRQPLDDKGPRSQQLQIMKDLSELLQQVWQLPEQQEAARLETAQAAAARSCAYLRCANLGGGGGPAAGQGSGSSKCSACRVAWYCGEGCSHADWRGPTGHRKTCKALGAAKGVDKRTLLLGAAGAGMLALGFGLSQSMLMSMQGSKDEAELAYRASQLGIPGVGAPMRPIINRQTLQAEALVVQAPDGRQFTATVDPQRPSRLLLQDTASRAVYALQTKVDRVNINNAAAMRVLFGDERWVGQLQQLRRTTLLSITGLAWGPGALLDSLRGEAALWQQEAELYSRKASEALSSQLGEAAPSSSNSSISSLRLDPGLAAALLAAPLAALRQQPGPAAGGKLPVPEVQLPRLDEQRYQQDFESLLAQELPYFQQAAACGHCGSTAGAAALTDAAWFDFQSYIQYKALGRQLGAALRPAPTNGGGSSSTTLSGWERMHASSPEMQLRAAEQAWLASGQRQPLFGPGSIGAGGGGTQEQLLAAAAAAYQATGQTLPSRDGSGGGGAPQLTAADALRLAVGAAVLEYIMADLEQISRGGGSSDNATSSSSSSTDGSSGSAGSGSAAERAQQAQRDLAALRNTGPELDGIRQGAQALLRYFVDRGYAASAPVAFFGASKNEERDFVAATLQAWLRRCGVASTSLKRYASYSEPELVANQWTLRRVAPLPEGYEWQKYQEWAPDFCPLADEACY